MTKMFPPTFLAVSLEVPRVGEECTIKVVEANDGAYELVWKCTSKVRSVEKIADTIYRVNTKNSVYFVQVY